MAEYLGRMEFCLPKPCFCVIMFYNVLIVIYHTRTAVETKPQYVSIKEAAELLGVTPTTLRNWDKSGKLTAQRDPVNQYRLYSVEDIARLLQERSAVYQVVAPPVELTVSQPSFFPPSSPLAGARATPDARALRLLVRQMSRAFRDSMGGGVLERFEEISKLLYCKLYAERESLSKPDCKPVFYRQPDEPFDKTYQRVAALYQRAVALMPQVLNSHCQLSDDKKAIARIVEILQDVNLSDIPADVKGVVYEELVRNTFEKSENQQFFTPRPVVNFMVRFVNPEPGHKICDPACGSGGFLIEAARHIRAGADQRMRARNFSGQLFGLEIDRRMAWVAQMNLVMHGNGQGQVHYLSDGGSLAFSDHLDALIRPGSLDVILTNPPFGSDFSDSKHLPRYQLGRGKSSRRRGILFVERCIGWLKPGGRLGIILDDSVLNGASNKDVRSLILRDCIVEAVISLPDVTFMPYATAKASVIFMRKRKSEREAQPPIFMADVEQVGRKPNGDPLYAQQRDSHGGMVLLDDLPGVVEAWRDYTLKGEQAIAHLSPKIFACSPEQLGSDRRLDVQFHHPSRKTAQAVLQQSAFPTPRLAELVVVRNVTAVPASQDPDEVWQYVGLANIAAETGEYTVSQVLGSELKSTVRLFRPGDILFSKLRPELRKCALIRDDEDEGFASSECLVFCTLENAMRDPSLQNIVHKGRLSQPWQVDSEYLAFILRGDIVFGQLVYQITGVGRPRVSQAAILGLQIPLPPMSVQREIVATFKMAWRHYLECRKRSEIALSEGAKELQDAYTYTAERLLKV